MVVNSYDELMNHKDHRVVVSAYGVPGEEPDVVAFECLVCGEILLQYPRPQGRFDKTRIRSKREEYPYSTGVSIHEAPFGVIYASTNPAAAGTMFVHRPDGWQMLSNGTWTPIRAEFKPYAKTTDGAHGVIRWTYAPAQGAS